MALTNTEKQARFGAKRDAELKRLRKIAAKVQAAETKPAKAKRRTAAR